MATASNRAEPSGRLGIIAGGGSIPRKLYDEATAQGRNPYLVALVNQALPSEIGDIADSWIRLGQGGQGLVLLREAGVTDLIMAGPVRRPTLAELRPDGRTAKFVAKAGRRFLMGDDSLLRAVIEELEAEGFRVHEPHRILGDLLAPQGTLTKAKPGAEDWDDIRRGIAVVEGLSALDIGQGCVVQRGIVLAVEAAEGTDRMIARCPDVLREGGGGVLVKLCKTGQETRADMPTIGPETVRAAAAAGLAGIAFEAAGAWLVDRDEAIADADRLGVFLSGVDPVDVKARGR
ncbi:MAG: UDP-2,3-diacylglucosamine diphosphatase LpxI [Alphaproteobacteria bacterium]|nr:UDP-2,3-diacylglucosamine diphosphatase LpxI [Alphaproteobacteria bacterium]